MHGDPWLSASLSAAVRAGRLAAAADLIRSGADVSRSAPDGLTPLMIASGLGQPQMVELLLTAGAQVFAVEPRAGATALHKAALSGSPDVVGLLLDHGAFIDQQSPILGHTALMDAVVYKHGDVVRLLLRRGARTAIRNHWQETALDLARRDGLDAIAGLIEARNEADAEEVGAQTLVPAIKAGDLGEVERLIAQGAPVNARLPMMGSPDDDYTPLAIAAREGHADIVRALLEAGANPRRVIGLFLGTALHEASYFGHADVVRAMTERCARAGTPASELDAQGAYNGMTPLHDAVWHGHLEAARALVEAGHPLHLRTHAGLTPRELAVLYGYSDLARFLADAEQAQAGPATIDHPETSEVKP
ncbi:ankyrin repeat domain-containing protein [Arenibaculum pallidiluteum]|uniref:ankyrin repeat domain-containing protein n=1 Tax=Arenibaculum pallidiluteum TaxID=2812559 RepID=UPI001A966E82|nr:ankyrin repeat domain-containing protein [Arenibaculum pallidiluteum]